MADSSSSSSSNPSIASSDSESSDIGFSSEEPEQPLTPSQEFEAFELPMYEQSSENSDRTLDSGRYGDDENQDSHDFLYPYILSLLERENLVPGTGKIRERRLNSLNQEVGGMSHRMAEILEDLRNNYKKRDSEEENYNKLEKRRLQDAEQQKESRPTKLQKPDKKFEENDHKLEKRRLQDAEQKESRPTKLRKPDKKFEILQDSGRARKLNGKGTVSPRSREYLVRLSNDVSTQVMLLNGLINYRRINGVYPFVENAALRDFITNVLQLNIQPERLMFEIDLLWRWYQMNGIDFESFTEDERELANLIRRIWGAAMNFFPENGGLVRMENDSEAGPSNAANGEEDEKQEVQDTGKSSPQKDGNDSPKDEGTGD